MTAATNERFRLYTGDDKELVFTVRDRLGAQVDCTAATAVEFRLVHVGPGVIIKSLGSGIDIEPSSGGKPRVTLLAADTAGLADQVADYELDVTLAGKKTTVARGTIYLVSSLV